MNSGKDKVPYVGKATSEDEARMKMLKVKRRSARIPFGECHDERDFGNKQGISGTPVQSNSGDCSWEYK